MLHDTRFLRIAEIECCCCCFQIHGARSAGRGARGAGRGARGARDLIGSSFPTETRVRGGGKNNNNTTTTILLVYIDRQDRIKPPRRTWRTPPPHPPPTLPSADDTTHTQRSEASDHQCAQSPTDPTRCPWTYSIGCLAHAALRLPAASAVHMPCRPRPPPPSPPARRDPLVRATCARRGRPSRADEYTSLPAGLP